MSFTVLSLELLHTSTVALRQMSTLLIASTVAITRVFPYWPILEHGMCQQMKYKQCHPQEN
jgi:hypothetical protein